MTQVARAVERVLDDGVEAGTRAQGVLDVVGATGPVVGGRDRPEAAVLVGRDARADSSRHAVDGHPDHGVQGVGGPHRLELGTELAEGLGDLAQLVLGLLELVTHPLTVPSSRRP